MTLIKESLSLREEAVKENAQLRQQIAERMVRQPKSRTLKIATFAFSSGFAVLALAFVITPSFSPTATGVFAPQIASAAEILKRADQVITDAFANGKIVRMIIDQTNYQGEQVVSKNQIDIQSDGTNSVINMPAFENTTGKEMSITFLQMSDSPLPSVLALHEEGDTLTRNLGDDAEAINSWEGIASRLMTDSGEIDETALKNAVGCENCSTMLATVEGSEMIGNEDAYRVVLRHPEGSENMDTYVSWIGKTSGQLLQREVYNGNGERTMTQRFTFTVLDTFTGGDAFQE